MTLDSKLSGEAAAIAYVQLDWLNAVAAANVERLVAMVTDDIVVVHGNGRCLHGKDELREDFQRGFEAFSIHQSASPVEVIVRGRWAFDASEIDTELIPRSGAEPKLVHSTAVTALHQQPDESWRVARVLGVFD